MSLNRTEGPGIGKQIIDHAPALERVYHAVRSRRFARERDDLFEELEQRNITKEDHAYLKEKLSFAYWYHLGERRLTGEPYIFHPLAVAKKLARNPYIPDEEIKDHLAIAFGHDLPENTYITHLQLARQMDNPVVTKGILLLSRHVKSVGGDQQSRKENFRHILESGDLRYMRVKIADWEHNLETTPESTKGYPRKKWNKIGRLQSKFAMTSEYILPLVRQFPKEEQDYLYLQLLATYDAYRPQGTPDLETLETAA